MTLHCVIEPAHHAAVGETVAAGTGIAAIDVAEHDFALLAHLPLLQQRGDVASAAGEVELPGRRGARSGDRVPPTRDGCQAHRVVHQVVLPATG